MAELQRDPAAVKLFDFLSELPPKGELQEDLSDTLERAQSAFVDQFCREDAETSNQLQTEDVVHVL